MKKLLKWIGIVLGVILAVLLVAMVGLYASTSLKLSRRYQVQPVAITIPTDAASIQRGEHIAAFTCADCHSADMSGKNIFSDPMIGEINGPNLTSGKGGIGAEFSDEDWVRAILYGVDNKGRGLLAIPSSAYYTLSDQDVGSLVAYLKILQPVDKEWNDPNLKLVGRIMAALGLFGDILPTSQVLKAGPRPAAPPVGITAEYGGYLVRVTGCRDCHGQNLQSGKSPDPKAPPVGDLTSNGNMAKWKDTDFITAMQTGVLPNGYKMSSYMPWKTFANMSKDELEAVWLYLMSLPAAE